MTSMDHFILSCLQGKTLFNISINIDFSLCNIALRVTEGRCAQKLNLCGNIYCSRGDGFKGHVQNGKQSENKTEEIDGLSTDRDISCQGLRQIELAQDLVQFWDSAPAVLKFSRFYY
jgi:hypothetical protein